MTCPDKKQSIFLLTKWKNMHAGLKTMLEGMKPTFGCLANSPLFDTTWSLFDAYTLALAAQLGDEGGVWMEWYSTENKMGVRGHEAGYDGKVKPIKSLTDLYGLILKGRARK